MFFISESEVTQGKMIEIMKIKGYELHLPKTLESRRKGRIIAYVKQSQGIIRKSGAESDDDDMLVFNVNGVTIVGIYSGFKISDGETQLGNFNRLLIALSRVAETSGRLIIGGDFNADPSRDCPKTRLLDLWD